ncbi:DapH/DapD/GlmU-related protein [Gluconacetobacter entanii]
MIGQSIQKWDALDKARGAFPYPSDLHRDHCVHLQGAGAEPGSSATLLDVVSVRIGDGTQIGPGVQILAADHPRDPALREKMLESGRPVTISRNVWIGGGAIILPGITIGDHAIIGAGSVVTRDAPSGVTVAGNPARPLHL